MKPAVLSPHLSVAEFLATQHRQLLDAQEKEWGASPHLYVNAQRFAVSVFEPIRQIVGPMLVTSGFRCYLLNHAVHGAENSRHTMGLAADVVPLKMNLVDAASRIRDAVNAGGLPDLDRSIFEFGRWLHLQAAITGERPSHRCLQTFDGVNYAAFDVADPRVAAKRTA